ncbi:MAG TPA: helix-turn-helix domain-containing protein [Terriglobales bacterium]|nr:helix-turn-helix domain-containing protein [Terriglobales bacterium]
MQATLEPIRFSTAALPDHERVPVWREVFGRQVVKVEMEPLGDGPFHSEADIRILPDLTISAIKISANKVHRTPQLVADGSDDFIFALMTEGQAHASQNRREASFGPGEAILWSNAKTGTCSYGMPIEFFALTIPREILRTMVADPDRVAMSKVPRQCGITHLLAHYLKLLMAEIEHVPPELRAISAAHVRDLVSLTVGATRDAAATARERGVKVARLQALKADIIANITDRALSIDMLAVRHGISPRYIRALFRGEDTCLTDFMLEQRLACVHRRLQDRRFRDWTISGIAYESGFGDLSHFNHCFRRRYGMTPSDVRAAGLTAGEAADWQAVCGQAAADKTA